MHVDQYYSFRHTRTGAWRHPACMTEPERTYPLLMAWTPRCPGFSHRDVLATNGFSMPFMRINHYWYMG